MKALPFPCIRPAQDRVLEALPAMGSILSGNDALPSPLPSASTLVGQIATTPVTRPGSPEHSYT